MSQKEKLRDKTDQQNWAKPLMVKKILVSPLLRHHFYIFLSETKDMY